MICDDVQAMVINSLGAHRTPGDPVLLAHLESCAACQAAREHYETLWRELGGLAVAGPSPDARARFTLRLAAERLATPSPAPRSAVPWSLGGVAAALLVAALTGYFVGARRPAGQTAPVPSEAVAAEPTYLFLLHEDSLFLRGEAPVPKG